MCNSRITPSIEDVKDLQIPLHEISLATNRFADDNLIAKGGFGAVYKGVSEKHGEIAVKRLDRGRVNGQGDHEFKMEISLLSKYKHDNIVSLLGFCDEDDEKILVYKYEGNGSLDKHLENQNLTYNQRIQICLDVAHGLNHILDNDGSQREIFHRDVKSANILLDKNWNAKISDFGLSRVGPDNMQSSYVISNVCGTPRRIAPEYYTDGYLTAKTDVYSFGIVLWEVLCGRNVDDSSYTDDCRSLNVLVRKHYKKGTLYSIIPSHLRKQINPASLLPFAKIAYQCLKNEEERPTMKQVVEQLEKALDHQQTTSMFLSIEEVEQLQQIPLQDILSAANEFSGKNVIGSGIHKGISEKYGSIVIRWLDSGLDNLEIMTEIAYLAKSKRKCIASFLGYCDEGGEKIIVYKDTSSGTLNHYLRCEILTHIQRLRICLDIASGLKYLDDSDDVKHIINRHIKSTNILLDKDLKPTFGFELSTKFVANMQSNSVITNPYGRPGYIDPDDLWNGNLRQKSDVYSLGVVLWELLCGRRFTSDKDDPQSLLNLVQKHYKNQTLDRIIPSYLFKQMNKDSLATFSSIAYRCVNNEEERPTLRMVEEQLQKDLDQQLLSDCSSHQHEFDTDRVTHGAAENHPAEIGKSPCDNQRRIQKFSLRGAQNGSGKEMGRVKENMAIPP